MLTSCWGTVESRWWSHRPARSRQRRKRSPSPAADRSGLPGRRTRRRSASTHPGNRRQPRSPWPLRVALLRAARAAKNARRAHNAPRRAISLVRATPGPALFPLAYSTRLTWTIKPDRYPYTDVTSFIHCGQSDTTAARAAYARTHARNSRSVPVEREKGCERWSRDGSARAASSKRQASLPLLSPSFY